MMLPFDILFLLFSLHYFSACYLLIHFILREIAKKKKIKKGKTKRQKNLLEVKFWYGLFDMFLSVLIKFHYHHIYLFWVNCMKLMENIKNNVWDDYELSMFMLYLDILKIACRVRSISRGSELLTRNILKKERREKYDSIRSFFVLPNKSKFLNVSPLKKNYFKFIVMKKDCLSNNFRTHIIN